MLLFLTGLITGLLIGFCAGGWSYARYQVRKRKAYSDPSEFSVGWSAKP